MSDMIWTTKSQSWYDEFEETNHPEKTVTFEINTDDTPWTSVLNDFLQYLNASGYIIDPAIIPDMVAGCDEIHAKHIFSKHSKKENNHGYI